MFDDEKLGIHWNPLLPSSVQSVHVHGANFYTSYHFFFVKSLNPVVFIINKKNHLNLLFN